MSERLILKDTKLVRLTHYPGEDSTTQTLNVRSLLTRTLASQLKCEANCFAESGVPRRYCDLKLTGLVIDNCEVLIDSSVWLAYEVSHFKIGRAKDAGENDASLELQCNLHFDGAVALTDWFNSRNHSTFEVTMQPPNDWNAQASLFEQSDPDAAGEEDDEDGDAMHCVDCENEVPYLSGSSTVHASGQPCPVAEANEAANGPVIASAREAAGGTHQRKRKGAVVTDIGVN